MAVPSRAGRAISGEPCSLSSPGDLRFLRRPVPISDPASHLIEWNAHESFLSYTTQVPVNACAHGWPWHARPPVVARLPTGPDQMDNRRRLGLMRHRRWPENQRSIPGLFNGEPSRQRCGTARSPLPGNEERHPETDRYRPEPGGPPQPAPRQRRLTDLGRSGLRQRRCSLPQELTPLHAARALAPSRSRARQVRSRGGPPCQSDPRRLFEIPLRKRLKSSFPALLDPPAEAEVACRIRDHIWRTIALEDAMAPLFRRLTKTWSTPHLSAAHGRQSSEVAGGVRGSG